MNSVSLICNDNLFQTVSLDKQDFPEAALYIVGLPIGNLADISLRALWTLSHSDIIAAEDTRESKKLLEKFNISVPLYSVHQHNEQQGAQYILQCLAENKRVSVVTDAGTPAVSDPGSKVVRQVLDAGYRVIPIPGASAVVTAVSASGMEPEGFCFHGFLEGGSAERTRTLESLSRLNKTFVLYEAPHRISKLLTQLSEILPPDRRVAVARELTKKFETIVAMPAGSLREWTEKHKPQGEYVVIVNAYKTDRLSELDLNTLAWLSALAEELPTNRLAAIASSVTGHSKKDLYQTILSLKQNTESGS